MIFKIVVLVIMNYLTLKFVIIPIFKALLFAIHIRKSGIRTSGIIIGERVKKDLDNLEQYAAIIKFETNRDSEILLESDDYRFEKVKIGSQVTVDYDPESPQKAIVNSGNIIVFKIFLLTFGIGLLGFIDLAIIAWYI